MVAEVDATVAVKTAEEVGVDGYPTLKLMIQGHGLDYSD